MRGALLTVFLLIAQAVPESQLVKHYGYKVEKDCSMARCVSCHNGQPGKGRDVSRCTADSMCRIYGKHLVDVSYPPPGKEHKYATLEEAELRGFSFDNGHIVCTTCHSLTSFYEHLLVMDHRGEQLCQACHLY